MAKGSKILEDEEEEEEEEEFEEGDDLREHEGGAEGGSDEEDEEEGPDEYEKDDFIVDEDDEEEPEEEEEAKESSDEEVKARKKKRKKRNEENDELDEDDYELLREHNVFHRPKSSNKQKFKRLKKAGKAGRGDDRGSVRGFSDEDEEEEGNKRGRTAEEELKRTLFGDDEGVPADDVVEEEEPEEEDEEIDDEDDEMAGFIVDEEDGEDDGFRRRKTKKKKAPRGAPGISSFALQEAQDIFGDVTALLDERHQRELEAQRVEMDVDAEEDGLGRRKQNKLLEKQFEPSLLESKFMTEKDDHIRDTDVPERLQLLEEIVGKFPSANVSSTEALWIYDRAFGPDAKWRAGDFRRVARANKQDIIRQIGNVLQFLHEEKLEVPFIAMYRKEKCMDLLQESDDNYGDSNADGRPELKHYEALWAVQHWDKKWLLLRRRKAGLELAFEKRSLFESRKGSHREDLFESLLSALSDCQSDQAVDDVDAKFNLLFPPDENELEQGQFKRPKRRSFYSVCRKAGLGVVADHFGLSPEKFAENIAAMYKRHEVEDDPLPPEELASFHLGREFQDSQAVLKGARHMAVVEISAQPAVREFVRHVYMDKALLSTRPTTEGNVVIDTFHEYSGEKWLQHKPIDKFEDAQWLLIQRAEEEKLLEVTIGLHETVITGELVPEFEAVYLGDGVSGTGRLWNEQRKEILKESLQAVILPAMEKEARMLLTSRSKQWVAAESAKELWSKVSVGPYVPEKSDIHGDADASNLRVMACCWGPGKPATTFVMLDASGEIVNILYTGYLTIRADNHEQKERKKQDQAKLLQFMRDNQPHVVALGAANLSCRRLKDEIYEEVVFKILEEYPRDLAEGLSSISVVFVDETIPQLYENSRISEEQLVGQSGIVRRAVGLGRYLQNPLAMVATLCGPDKEVLSLKLHSLQSFLTPDEVYETVERVMVTVTNQVGVDVNLAASHDWHFAPLQFVCGLGPRKTSYIQRSIQGAGRVSTRRELLSPSVRLMGRKVFINCAGFIRVRGTGQASSGNQIMDPLDDTRVHPESYELAERMAQDAYCEVEGTKAEDMDEESLEMAVDYVKKNPNILENMDLEAYASHVAKKWPVANMQNLQMIRMELENGYMEWRNPYEKMSQDTEFHTLSGESEDTLAEGSIVHARVRLIQQSRVMCALESGLLGIINKDDISDDSNVDPQDKLSEGTVVTCRVKAVHKANYKVELTCRGSALRGENWTGRRPKDPYYLPDLSYLRIEQEKSEKKTQEEKRNTFKPRMIVHPQFQNVSVADATEALSDKDIGEVIIRPSSKGPSHLSMTLKFYDGVHVHMDIVEGGKDSRDITSFLRLGKTLTIGDETFEDLDEVLARYIDPLVSQLKGVLRYRKFKRGSKAEVDESLREEKVKNPMRIPYFLSICQEHPGALRLSYIKNVHTVSHEYISVSPKGLKFRKRLFDSPDKLVSYFQKHFTDPLPDVAPRRAMAAMVPSRSPAPSANGNPASKSWGPPRPGDAAAPSGWDSYNGWDQSAARGRTSDSWGRGAGPSGSNMSWDHSQGASYSGAGWAPNAPPSEAAAGWKGWGKAPEPAGYGAAGPPAGWNNWDGAQQGSRGGFKAGTSGEYDRGTGFPDAQTHTPVSESNWGSRNAPSSSSKGWDTSGGTGGTGGTWSQPPDKIPTRSGWDSEQESHRTGRSRWDEDTGDKGGTRTQTGGWRQSRADPRRGAVGREGTKQFDSGWEQGAAAKESSGWDSSYPTPQNGGNSASWEAPMDSNTKQGVGSTWESATVKEGRPSGWDTSIPSSQSGGSSAQWEAPVKSSAQNETRDGWTKMGEQPAQGAGEFISTETEDQQSGWARSNKGVSNWDQPVASSPAESGWGASQHDDWESNDVGNGDTYGTPKLHAQDSKGWERAGGVKDSTEPAAPGTADPAIG